MSHEALSKAMGPSLIGFSCAEPGIRELQVSFFNGHATQTICLLILSTDMYVAYRLGVSVNV